MWGRVKISVVPFALCVCAGCGFSGGAGGPTPAPLDPPWWDVAWSHRRQVTVDVGDLAPDKGYLGYTAFLSLDTRGMDVAEACRDLRLLWWSDETWRALPLHVAACGADGDLRFALPLDLAPGASWQDAYLYYGNPSADEPPRPGPTEVYLWWDDAGVDRTRSYTAGRMDPWLGNGYADTLQWNTGGQYYVYVNGNDRQASYRRPVDERDVLAEAEWFHTGCENNNIQTGVCVRGIIASGSLQSETADHYYCSSRAHFPGCNTVDDAIADGDILETDNEILAVDNPTNPPALVANQWRRQALAAFGANPTQLRFWDADASWPRLAAPPASALLTSGQDADDYESRGFAGIMTSQDVARVRNLVIRRYVEPEPVVTLAAQADR